MTNWPVQKQAHITTQTHVEHQDATNIQTIFFVFFGLLFFILFLFIISKMISPRNVELLPWYGQ